ncbi:MAG: efflux transporter outer membrane subunit [Proteobacteria bacterium]|nr:efflux transporter outer membrane subunit [Pseudomonadota bacterium]
MKSDFRLVLAGAACALLASCALHTPLPDLHADVPAQWRNAPADAGKLGPAPDLDAWWHAFNDAQLDALIQRALAQNLTVQQASLRLRGARALQHRSGTQFMPQVNFHTFSEPDPAATTSYYEIGFDAQWELGFFGRGLGNARVAAADLQAAETSVTAARVSLVAEVARSYVDLRAAQARAGLLDRIVDLRERDVELARTRLRLKLATQDDVDKAAGELAQARADAAEPAAAIAQAQQALDVLLAQSQPDANLASAAPQPVLGAVSFAQTPADLLRTRPEIRQAELDVLRAAGELGIARADLWPKLGLGGTLISSTRMVGDIDRPNKAIPSAGPMIDIPLLDWGARHDMANAREAGLQAAVLGYRQAVLEGVAEAESALAQWQRDQARADAAHARLALADNALTRAQTLRRIGLADDADRAQAGIAQAQAQLQASLAQRDAAIAFIAVYKSFGGTLPPLAMQ